MLREALLKAGVVSSEDVKRVERQQRIEAEEKRKQQARSEERQLIDSFHPTIRASIKNLRKTNPKVFTKRILQKLADAKGSPWLLADPELIDVMSYVTIETMRLDFQKLVEDGKIEKIKQDIKSGKTMAIDSISTQIGEEQDGKMRKMQS